MIGFVNNSFDYTKNKDIAWCPGCGNFSILTTLKKTLEDLGEDQRKLVFASGIGQAAKMPQYINTSFFNGLHGRSLPVATAIKASNPELIVIAEGGDGDMYGEGGNHFIHTVRRNPDITHIVHNNQVYGLTKGQGAPTSVKGLKTTLQLEGVHSTPINPIAIAITLGASFVARAYSNDKEQLQKILTAAIRHKGYALIDVLDPCVTFNKVNTHKWYKEHTYYLDETYDATKKESAWIKSLEEDKIPLGIIYQTQSEKTLEEYFEAYWHDSRPLYQRDTDANKLQKLFQSY